MIPGVHIRLKNEMTRKDSVLCHGSAMIEIYSNWPQTSRARVFIPVSGHVKAIHN